MSDYGQRLEALAAARTFLTNNGVRIDEASVRSLTADIFNETSLAGSHEAFAQAFTTLAKQFSSGIPHSREFWAMAMRLSRGDTRSR